MKELTPITNSSQTNPKIREGEGHFLTHSLSIALIPKEETSQDNYRKIPLINIEEKSSTKS